MVCASVMRLSILFHVKLNLLAGDDVEGSTSCLVERSVQNIGHIDGSGCDKGVLPFST